MKKGLMRSLKSSIEMSMGEVFVGLSGPEMQQSTIHVRVVSTQAQSWHSHALTSLT